MKVKFKLILFIFIIALIPVIVINGASSSRITKTSMELTSFSTSNIIGNQSENINFYFEDIISSAKNLASSEAVRMYTEESNSPAFNEPDARDERHLSIEKSFADTAAANTSLRKVMIINNSGMIIASTDPADTGRRMSNYKGLFVLAQSNNGVSSFFLSGDDDNIPVFIVSKQIFSYDNECQGIVYQLYNTSRLQNMINATKVNKYTTISLIDGSGTLLEYPYKALKTYTESDSYKAAGTIIAEIINTSGKGGVVSSKEYGSGRGERIIFSAPVTSCGWNMLAISDRYSLEKTSKASGNSVRNISIIILIISCILVAAFVYWFSKPVDEIIKVLQKKKKGDMNSKFDVRSSDEFSEIGEAFNSAFDDIFESEQRYRTVVDITNNIIFEVDFKRNYVFVSRNFNKKFSFRAKDNTIEESFFYKIRVHKDDKDRYLADIDRIMGSANFIQGEYRVKSIYGDFIWIMIKATKFFNREEVPTKIVGVIMDIDKEKKSEMHLIQRASNDALTQLYNRETFIRSLTAALEESEAKKSLDAMMFIDLDDFKFFNDEYGHACGDEVLKFVADTLKEISFERGFAGRFGGDEFVICLTDLTLYGDSGKLAQEIIDILAAGFISESTGLKLNIHCSVGIAFLRESGKNAEEVIAAADEAMYNIKKHGKSAYAYAKSPQKQTADSAPAGDNE